jgi:alpha-1,6-mannosyltransferase
MPVLFKSLTVRAVLGLCVIGAFRMFRQTIQLAFGHQLTNWFVAITVTQYHFMYYLSRPLPNIMALPLGERLWSIFQDAPHQTITI